MMLGFLIRSQVSEMRLFEAISRALGVPLDEVERFDIDRKSDAAVLVEVNDHTAGFLMDVNLYIDAPRVSNAAEGSSLEVAIPVAMDLQVEVLVGPPADDVYANHAFIWYLITPDGKRFIAEEVMPGETGDDIEINRATLRPA